MTMKRFMMLSLVLTAGCGRLFMVGDDSNNKDRLHLADGGVCGPVCAIYCEFGNVLGPDGCPTCSCNPDPNPQPVQCGNTTCPAGELCCNASCGICTSPGGACTQQACLPNDAGPQCPGVTCTLACQYGFQRGADGCEICACNPPPNPVQCGPNTCAAGEVCCNESCGICTPPDGACTQQWCGPLDAGPGPSDAGAPTPCGFNTCAAGTVCCNASCGICTPPGYACTQQVCACPPVVCTLACQYGFQRGADGCEICACAAPPVTCGNVTCGAGLDCCNASCGICAPPGQACIQIACN